jgi:predicted RNase H-like HicB family nuclease
MSEFGLIDCSAYRDMLSWTGHYRQVTGIRNEIEWPTCHGKYTEWPTCHGKHVEGVMIARYILTEYIDRAIAQAEYDKLDDGTYGGRIPACQGVIAFGATLSECQHELRSTVEAILGKSITSEEWNQL